MREEEPPAIGQRVRVIDGPFKAFVGHVDEINLETRKVKLAVVMFGRKTPVELDLEQIEQAE
jgi:transcriptional antiterminator NusG